MAGNWWADPLPPGWESKWDPAQNRYFFIDHATKKTSWVDPRSPEGRHQVAQPQGRYQVAPPTQQRPAPQPRAQAYGGGAAYPMQSMTVPCARCRVTQVPSTPYGQVCASCTAKASQVKCNLCNKTVVSKQGDVCTQCMNSHRQQETTFVRADQWLVLKLETMYPQAMESHIRAALEGNNNDEAKACVNLEKRGYKKVDPEEVKAEKLAEKLRSKYASCSKELLKTTIMSCDCNEVRVKAKLKELGFLTPEEKKEKEREESEAKAKRERVERTIRGEFPGTSSDVITMALESMKYDEARTRNVLSSMQRQVAAKNATAQQSAETPGTSASQPAAKPKAAAHTSPKKIATTASTSAVKSTTPKQQPAASTSTPKQQPKKQQQQHVQRDIPRRQTTSKLAHGPDPKLPRGAQDGLLLKGYTETCGPNSDLVAGPTCRVMGTQGAIGPDHSLARGPVRYKALPRVVAI